MITRLTKPFARFYHWWISALISCLPQRMSRYVTDIGNQAELVIAHQGDSIFIQSTRGRILESISLTQNVEIDLAKLPNEKTDLRADANNTLSNIDQDVLGQDPRLSSHAGEIDITLTEHKQEVDVNLLELAVSMESDDADVSQCDIDLSGTAKPQNVVPLNINRDDNTVRMVDDEDETARMLDLDSHDDDDTFIVQKDQGKLLQFGSVVAGAPDHTVLFASVGGKIRQLEAGISESDMDALASEGVAIAPKIDPGGGNLSAYRAVAQLLDRYQRNRKCLYLVPENELFLVKLSYPTEVMENLDGVLRFDLEKHIPVSVRGVRYFYSLNFDSLENRVDVDVAVIKSDDFDNLNQVLGRFVDRGLICTTEKFYQKYGNRINFLERRRANVLLSFFRFQSIHIALNYLLLGILFALPFYMLDQGIREVGEVPETEMRRVREIVTAISSVNDESRYGSQLSTQIGKTPRVVQILSTLSGNINDSAWLDRFTYREGEISIRGEAESATEVSDELSRTGWFDNIKFVSSIRKNPKSGKETFELVMRIKPDA